MEMEIQTLLERLVDVNEEMGRCATAAPAFSVMQKLARHRDILHEFTQGLDGDMLWSSIPKSNLISIALLLKQYSFKVVGKGQFKDEFVTAGGVPLSEISLNTMESKKQPNLFFAGEVLNIDGITGGFNFQNAWTGGYIAGTSIGTLSSSYIMRDQELISAE